MNIEEELENERGSNRGNDHDNGGTENGGTENGGTDHGTDRSQNSSRGTKSESGSDLTGAPVDQESNRESTIGGSLDERDDLQSSEGSLSDGNDNRGESKLERKRRLDRERKRKLRAERSDPSGSRSSDNARGTRNNSSQKTSVVVLDEPDLPKAIAKDQGAPREVKTKVSSASEKTRKAKAGDIDSNEMTMLIEGIFMMIGGVLNSPHWYITTDESKQISVPLVKMLNKQNKKRKDKVNDLMLPMLLVGAIGSVIVPRVMIQLEEWRIKRNDRKLAEQKRANQTIGSRSDQRKDSTNGGGVVPETTRAIIQEPTVGHDVKNANDVIPSIPPTLAGLFDQSY